MESNGQEMTLPEAITRMRHDAHWIAERITALKIQRQATYYLEKRLEAIKTILEFVTDHSARPTGAAAR